MSNQTQPGKLPDQIEQDIFNLVEKYLPLDKHHLTPNEAVDAVTVYAEKWWEVKQKLDVAETVLDANILANQFGEEARQQLQAENERLKKEIEELRKEHQSTSDETWELGSETIALREENERLKAALEEITRQDNYYDIIDIASKALASDGKEVTPEDSPSDPPPLPWWAGLSDDDMPQYYKHKDFGWIGMDVVLIKAKVVSKVFFR